MKLDVWLKNTTAVLSDLTAWVYSILAMWIPCSSAREVSPNPRLEMWVFSLRVVLLDALCWTRSMYSFVFTSSFPEKPESIGFQSSFPLEMLVMSMRRIASTIMRRIPLWSRSGLTWKVSTMLPNSFAVWRRCRRPSLSWFWSPTAVIQEPRLQLLTPPLWPLTTLSVINFFAMYVDWWNENECIGWRHSLWCVGRSAQYRYCS